jgi:UDP-arabinose 4-epimerase
MSRAVLVTGGAGYVGSHACKALARAGYLPVVYDDLRLGNAWAVRWGPFVQSRLEDSGALAMALREHRIEAVMHFAAYSNVGESMTRPFDYFHNNVSLTLNLLQAMAETGVQSLVISSTCAIYGMTDGAALTEDTAVAPISPYGASKAMMEEMARWFGVAHGIRTAALRYFNASGADPDGEIGECHQPETHLVPIAVQAALGQRPQMRINGTDYPTPDGTAIRDFIHVSDLAVAHVTAMEMLADGRPSMALNLGTGRGHSVREVIEAVAATTGRRPTVQEGPRRAGDPARLVADPTEAQRVLGWQPRWSSMETIAATAVRWHRDVLPNMPSRDRADPA